MKNVLVYRIHRIENNEIVIPVCDQKGNIVTEYRIDISEKNIVQYCGMINPLASFIENEAIGFVLHLVNLGLKTNERSVSFVREIAEDIGNSIESLAVYS